MPLPDDFSASEHLQDVLRKVHNRMVREEFKDVDVDDDFDPDLTIPRHSLRVACTITDNDTNDMILQRFWLYFLHLRKARDLHPPIVGMPKDNFDAIRKYRPQIQLFFREDLADVDLDYRPVEGTIRFRLMNETSETITKSELTLIANRIKSEFGVGDGYIWKKGKELVTYTDKNNGCDFRTLCFSKIDGENLIKKVLDVANVPWDSSKFSHKVNESPSLAYPTIPSNQTILGEIIKEPRRRPVANVRFQYSHALLWGPTQVIPLYDKTFTYLNALVDDTH